MTRRAKAHLRGREILEEFPEPIGATLWMLLRDVELWAAASPERRGRLFKLPALRAWSRAGVPDALAEALHPLMDALSKGDGDDPLIAASACSRIAEWSAPYGRHTALLYAEAAAQLDPASAAFARDVGRFALSCSVANAERWLNRASALARRSKDWVTLAHATADLAALYESLGDRRTAHATLLRARRLRQRYQLAGEVRARIETGLLRLTLLLGDAPEEIDAQVRRILRTYPIDNPDATDLRIVVVETLITAGRTEEAVRVARLYPWSTPEGNDRLTELELRAADAHAGVGNLP